MNAIKIWSTCSPYKVWTPQLVYNVTQDHDAALHLIFGFHEHTSMLQHSRQEYSTTRFVNKQIKCSYKKITTQSRSAKSWNDYAITYQCFQIA